MPTLNWIGKDAVIRHHKEVWQKKYAVSNDDPEIGMMHDYIISYRASSRYSRNLLPRTNKQLSRYTRAKHEELQKDNRLYWGPDMSYDKPRFKRFLHEIQDRIVPTTWWPFDECGHNAEVQKETGEIIGKKYLRRRNPPV